MLLSYLKLAVRLLLRNPFFTFINVSGLSVGFAVFIILWQYSQNELKSDHFQKDHDRVYRLITEIDFRWDGKLGELKYGYDVPIHTVRLVEKIPQVESFTRIYNQDNFNATWIEDHSSQLFLTVKSESGDENHFIEKHVAYADPNMFDFFGIVLLRGNALTVLNDANAVAISQHTAQKYFGSEDPMNKTLLLNNAIPLKVTGVFADLPKNTHLEFEVVISMHRLERSINEFRTSAKGGPISYLKLKQGVAPTSLEQLLKEDSRILTDQFNTDPNGTIEARLSLQPLEEIAFSNLDGDHFLSKSKMFLAVLNTIAAIVLIVAWINYINFTLSLNIKRNKELATRKTMGAKPSDLIKQFVVESAIVNILSLLIALTLIQLSKGALKTFFQFHIYAFDNDLRNTMGIALLAVGCGIIVTGFYPAISTLKAAPRSLFQRVVLPGQMRMDTANILMIIQYTCAIVLIIGVFAIQRQLDYILSRSIGINREGIVVLDLPIKQPENFQSLLKTFCNEIKDLSFVSDLTVSNNVVGDREENSVCVKKPSGKGSFVGDCNGGVDEWFLSCYGIRLLAGRNFLPQHPSDSTAILISRQGAKNLDYEQPGDIIGEIVLVQEKDFSEVYTPAQVIGVFEDYKRTTFFSSQVSHRKGDDAGIVLTYGDYMVPAQAPRKLSIRMSSTNYEQALEIIKDKYNKIFPGNAFNWSFLNENINGYYTNEKIARNQVILFSALVIAISCLGLLGMIMQRILLKTKEIGVRKVLGARLHHIGSLLLISTVKQMVVAFFIGIPIAWYATQQYLQRYTDHVDVHWWHYLVPVLVNCVIMVLTISAVVWKAAMSNPVEALKHE